MDSGSRTRDHEEKLLYLTLMFLSFFSVPCWRSRGRWCLDNFLNFLHPPSSSLLPLLVVSILVGFFLALLFLRWMNFLHLHHLFLFQQMLLLLLLLLLLMVLLFLLMILYSVYIKTDLVVMLFSSNCLTASSVARKDIIHGAIRFLITIGKLKTQSYRKE